MSLIQELSLELTQSQGDPQAFINLSQHYEDSLLWKQVTYRPEWQHIDVSDLKGSEVFLEVPQFSILKDEYKTLHPLCSYMVSVERAVKCIAERARRNYQAADLLAYLEGKPTENQEKYAQALLISERFRTFALNNGFVLGSPFLDFLQKLVQKRPEFIIDIFRSLIFQDLVTQEANSSSIAMNCLRSDDSLVRFSSDRRLKAARAKLFKNKPFWKKYCNTVAGMNPANIDKVLKEPDFQSEIIRDSRGTIIMSDLLPKSQRGPGLLVDPKCRALKEQMLEKKLGIDPLTRQHPQGSKELLAKAPQFLTGLSSDTLEIFKLAYKKSGDLVLIAGEDTFLEQWDDLKEKYLKKELTPSWFKKILKDEPSTFVKKLLDGQHQQWAESSVSIQMNFTHPIFKDRVKDITVYVIDSSKCHLDYLNNPDYRELVTTRKLSLSELLRAEPDELMQYLPHQFSYRPM